VSEPPAVRGGDDAAADVDALAAALRADSTDLDIYARVLTVSLSEALPAGMVEVQREVSLRDRMAGRPGVVRSVRIKLGDISLELDRGHGDAPIAREARAVRGVVISSKEITVDEWTRHLADHLAERARDSAAARAALAKLLGQSA